MCCLVKKISPLLSLVCLITSTYGQATNPSCGKRKVITTYLIHGGEDAVQGRWPWHVAVFHRNEYKCGGSIIDGNTILTAAHCVYDAHSVLSKYVVSVYAGQVRFSRMTEHTQTYDVEDIIVHPQFSGRNIIHDIALIKLTTNITLTKYVQPVCLWTMNNKLESIVGKNGTIVGFGLNEQDVLPDQLKEASIGVVDPLTCIQMDRRVFGTHLTWDMFCGIGKKNVSACNGDSGGGVFFEVGGKWFLRGLVSYTSARGNTNLCDPLKPIAFTDVAKYLDWIRQYIDQRVLSHEYDLFDINYEGKLRLFNFSSCGMTFSKNFDDTNGWILPWIGLIYIEKSKSFFCATTLISEWYAVGPASCFDFGGQVKSIDIVLGGFLNKYCDKINYPTQCSHKIQKREIRKVTNHPRYDRNKYAHNIALLELLSPADITQPNVKPICFPVTPELRTNVMSNLYVGTVYNGRIENLPMRYLESTECLRKYFHGKGTSNLENYLVCAENTNDTTYELCGMASSGSPLQEMMLLYRTERYFLRGLDLLGFNCNAQQPTVYLNAEPYLDWMLFNMNYHTSGTSNISLISELNQTLESEWITLQQQPGMEKLRLFNMNTCGVSPVLQQSTDHVPWIGFLALDVYMRSNEKVVLISEWYALAPKTIFEKDKDWQFIILGIYNKEVKMNNQEIEIRNIIIPSREHPRQPFALIELLEPADLNNRYIKPICLPFMKRLHQHNSTRVVLSSNLHVPYFYFNNVNLTVMDRPSCEERLFWNGVSLLNETSTCAIENTWSQKYMQITFGSPLQLHMKFGDSHRYFLYGIDIKEYDNFNNHRNGIYLFHKIELTDLEWIVNNMQEKDSLASSSTERSEFEGSSIP